MKNIDTHGLKMTGLRKICSDTKGLGGYYSGEYVEIFYDLSTGKVWGEYQYSLGQNSWTRYDDASVIKCGNMSRPATMQEVSDMVWEKVSCKYDLGGGCA